MADPRQQQSSSDDDVPATLERSDPGARDTYRAARDSARETYDDDDQRAARVAWAAVKHTHEKVGDHWEPKADGRTGPSDDHAAGGVDDGSPTAGGVDAGATKAHLLALARRLDVPGRSSMTKDELVTALQKANDAATRRARG